MPLSIRRGEAADLPALTAIYNHYVLTSAATFDTVVKTVGERADWFVHYGGDGPHRLLVAADGPRVLGYATSSPFRERPGYATSVETSVYLAQDARGAGLGRRLYDTLLPLVDAAGIHRAYAGVALPNPASVALHERCGFARVGLFAEVGWKLGRWVDVAWYERRPHGR